MVYMEIAVCGLIWSPTSTRPLVRRVGGRRMGGSGSGGAKFGMVARDEMNR